MCIKPYLKQVEGVGRVVTLKKLSVLITYSITVGVVTRQKIQGGRDRVGSGGIGRDRARSGWDRARSGWDRPADPARSCPIYFVGGGPKLI